MAVSALRAFQIFQIAGGTNQQPQISALIGKNTSYVGAQKSGRASDENFQQQFSSCQVRCSSSLSPDAFSGCRALTEHLKYCELTSQPKFGG